jgi:alpha-mannosidase
MWRGADASLETTEFFWQAPDGSEVLAIHKPFGYGIAGTLPSATKALLSRVRSIRDQLEPYATTSALLLMNGGDHVPPQVNLSTIIHAANVELDDAALEHVSLPEVFERVRRHMGSRAHEWPRHFGEFRSGQRAHLLPGVLSARIWIKQMNQECEDLLAHWAEPFSVWADALKRDVGPEWHEPLPATTAHMPFPTSLDSVTALIDRAWRHLLENQPHDSICGCSVDPVHEEMRQRYEWVRTVGNEIMRQSLRTIGALGPDDPLGTITVFNPTPQTATGRVEVTVPWSAEQPIAAVLGPEGERIEAQLTGEPVAAALPEGAPPGFDRLRAEIAFVARDVPGYGYRTYRLQPGAASPPATSVPGAEIDNDLFAVAASTDGTVSVTDRRSGRVLTGLNRFVDGGDRGDEYNYCAPQSDTIVSRPDRPPNTRVSRMPGSSTLSIEMTYRLPAGLAADRASRSAALADERIVTAITLTDGVPRIDVRTTVFNAAEDHRLRVHFPSGIHAETSSADQHFGVIRRPVALPAWDPETWMEQPLGTYPQKAFVSVDDGERGLTIANRGLPEYEAVETDGGLEIALTLLRCVGWLSRADLTSRRGGAGPQLRTPGAQLPGKHVFEYSIIPHAGGWEQAGAHVLATQHLRPMRARWNRHGLSRLPAEGSLLEIDSQAFQVSAVKRAEDGDGVIVRVYNTSDDEAECTIDLTPMQGTVTLVNLNEEALADVPRVDGSVFVSARPNEIVSLRFRPE